MEARAVVARYQDLMGGGVDRNSAGSRLSRSRSGQSWCSWSAGWQGVAWKVTTRSPRRPRLTGCHSSSKCDAVGRRGERAARTCAAGDGLQQDPPGAVLLSSRAERWSHRRSFRYVLTTPPVRPVLSATARARSSIGQRAAWKVTDIGLSRSADPDISLQPIFASFPSASATSHSSAFQSIGAVVSPFEDEFVGAAGGLKR